VQRQLQQLSVRRGWQQQLPGSRVAVQQLEVGKCQSGSRNEDVAYVCSGDGTTFVCIQLKSQLRVQRHHHHVTQSSHSINELRVQCVSFPVA
jgi:hypothetical protein